MAALDDIIALISDKGIEINQNDLDQITIMSVDVPLEDSDDLAMVMEGVALTVNDPMYKGDIAPFE